MPSTSRVSTGSATESPPASRISRSTVLMVDCGELGSGGNRVVFAASEVVLQKQRLIGSLIGNPKTRVMNVRLRDDAPALKAAAFRKLLDLQNPQAEHVIQCLSPWARVPTDRPSASSVV